MAVHSQIKKETRLKNPQPVSNQRTISSDFSDITAILRRAQANPGSLSQQEIMQLHNTMGNAALRQLLSERADHTEGSNAQQSPHIQRMTYGQIKPLAGVRPETEARLSQIAQVAGMTESDSVPELFNKLVSYGHSNFSYDSGGAALSAAVASNTYNCETISSLFIVLCLLVKNENINTRVQNVTAFPLLYTGAIGGGGFKNQSSNVIGNEHLVYSGGHSMAEVDGQLYDVSTGVAGGMNAVYVEGETLGNQQYRFNLGGESITLERTDQVIGGLWVMKIV